MECIAARNMEAMAVSVFPITSTLLKNKLRYEMGFPINRYSLCVSAALRLRVRCRGASTGSESCLALPVKEDFADEQDYVKAGGSELFFVQMQRNKDMDQQSKLSDKSVHWHGVKNAQLTVFSKKTLKAHGLATALKKLYLPTSNEKK